MLSSGGTRKISAKTITGIDIHKVIRSLVWWARVQLAHQVRIAQLLGPGTEYVRERGALFVQPHHIGHVGDGRQVQLLGEPVEVVPRWSLLKSCPI